ncbi:MAG: DUF5931 domain-containing protein [Streptosporangiaceae bacterium]
MSSLQAPLWRSIAVFRFASLAYAAVLLGFRPIYYQRWGWAWAVLAAMIAWTVISTMGYAVPVRRTRLLLGADLVLTAAALLSTSVLQWPPALHRGVMPVTTTWLAGPALAWAVAAELEAASRERERLARSIHDSVLQVLAMVQRRGGRRGGRDRQAGRPAGGGAARADQRRRRSRGPGGGAGSEFRSGRRGQRAGVGHHPGRACSAP